jgi:hypothetical protein
MQAMARSSARFRAGFLASAAVVALFITSEVGYRIYLYHEFTRNPDAYTRYGFSTTEAPLYLLDEKTGYSYAPNVSLHFRLYGEGNNFQRENTLHSNNYGHIALEDDAIERGKDEFRIAVIGDSFSATPTSDVTWPTELQQQLNQDELLKKVTGWSFFKVINFGLDGTGFEQWPNVYENRVKPFHPDLVLINFIWNDLLRRFMYRKTVTIGQGDQVMISCSSLPAELATKDCLNAYSFVIESVSTASKKIVRIKRELLSAQVSQLPWLSPGPEFLRMLVEGHFVGQPRLRIQRASLPLFDSQEKALAASERAVREIASQQPALMLLYHPTLEECLAKEPAPLGAEFMRREPRFAIENMLQYLPLDTSKEELQKWYNVPYDWHPSSYGAAIYAQAVRQRVADYIRKIAAKK